MKLPPAGPVFEAYWKFATERHQVFQRRQAGLSAPWTDDDVLARFKFTNAFRVLDRTSQSLVREVINRDSSGIDDLVLRVLLFKIFNRGSTWTRIVNSTGLPTAASFDEARIGEVLEEARATGERIYSSAYIIPPTDGKDRRKHVGHLRLLSTVLDSSLPQRLESAGTLEEVYRLLLALPGFGRFLAFQFAIDLNYSDLLPFNEDSFVVAGPGAMDGLSKCFPGADLRNPEAIIFEVTRQQEEWFDKLDLDPVLLEGRRLQPIDIQNLFCEISKYSRVAFPSVQGVAGRTRIKQSFVSVGELSPTELPKKWEAAVDATRSEDDCTNQSPTSSAVFGKPGRSPWAPAPLALIDPRLDRRRSRVAKAR